MTDTVIIHCDKCDSTAVLHEEIVSPPTVVHKTMSEVAAPKSNTSFTYDVHHYRLFRMVCKECGHIVKYQK